MIKSIAKKIKAKEDLTDKEREILLFALEQQQKCIEYYSQNFAGTWDSDEVNVNWRATKYNKELDAKIKEVNDV